MKTIAKLALAAMLAASIIQPAVGSASENPKAAYVASVNREPFHKPTCRWAEKISDKNLQTFKTRDEAIKAGHRPCKVCKP